MATYAQLDDEAAWREEVEAPALARFNARLREHYDLSRANCGSKGDNNHLRGRHRSRRWCLTSQWCTGRAYGTTSARDKRGNENWLRATDVGIQGQELRDASRRVDAAVRAGKLPQLAEWFGTTDGEVVVGWYEGHASSSDTSHLYHLHLGYRTESADDAAFFDLLYTIITGDDMDQKEQLTAKTAYSKRTVGDVLGDVSNLRDGLVAKPGAKLGDQPYFPAGSALDVLVTGASALPGVADRLTAIEAALTEPTVITDEQLIRCLRVVLLEGVGTGAPK